LSEIDARARLEQRSHAEADDVGDECRAEIKRDRLQSDRAKPRRIAERENAGDERQEDQRDDQQPDEPDENVAGDANVAEQGFSGGGVHCPRHEESEDDAQDEAQKNALPKPDPEPSRHPSKLPWSPRAACLELRALIPNQGALSSLCLSRRLRAKPRTLLRTPL
jgi:hypothetical protein